MKEIDKCPVCGSEVVQDTHQTTSRHVVMKTGSHCPKCGFKFVFNKKE